MEIHFLFTLSNQNTLEAGRHPRLAWLFEILPQKRQKEEGTHFRCCLPVLQEPWVPSPARHGSLGCSARTGEVEAERSKFKDILSQTSNLSPAWANSKSSLRIIIITTTTGHGSAYLCSQHSEGRHRSKQICDFEARLVCIVSSRTSKTIETLSQRTN